MSSLPYVQPNIYPAGNIVLCRFCFTTRALTSSEQSAFLTTGSLPGGVGVDQFAVQCEYHIDNGPLITLSGPSVVRDAQGAYHVALTASTPGSYTYRGFSLDPAGYRVAETAEMRFVVV